MIATDGLTETRHSKQFSIQNLKSKMVLGAKVGILINPNDLAVNVYRPNGSVEVLTGDDKLTICELFPGWKVAISELWPPVFE